MIRLEVRAGPDAGKVFELDRELTLIGRTASSDVLLTAPSVAERHARLLETSTGLLLEGSLGGPSTARIRRGERVATNPGNLFRLTLREGDLIELGSGEGATVLAVVAIDVHAPDPHVVALRKADEVGPTSTSFVRDPSRVARIIELQRQIGAAESIDDVLAIFADAALELVPTATHATLVLHDDSSDDDAYVPVLTRVRGPKGGAVAPDGPVPVARSVFRKVVSERATILAADAPKEVGSSDSLLGASIRSTIGVPLFRGDTLVGVLQVDNRDAPGMLTSSDVDTLALLSASASLAVANARLIEQLQVAESRLRKENHYLKGRDAQRRGTRDILGRSPAMANLLSQIERVAGLKVSVLIEGETGTGKELVASALHYRSRRADKLFVTQNCAALPDNLLESELFGHRKGAFTGAHEEKKGLFEIADQGTLFLDEIAELPLTLQAKLLRVVQEGELRPVGSTTARYVDVRIVAATHQDLKALVAAGKFREDLYYRLNVFPVRVPPLRSRREDIPLLAGHFLSAFSREIGKSTGGFAQQTMEMLLAHEWPGNVRELQNEIQRLVIQVEPDGIITPDLLSQGVRKIEEVVLRAGVTRGASLKEMMEQLERFLINETLRAHNDNRTNAAKALGMSREGFQKKIRALGIKGAGALAAANAEAERDSDADDDDELARGAGANHFDDQLPMGFDSA